MQVTYENVTSNKVKDSFDTVLQAYEALHEYTIILKQKPIRGSTMQAQPIISPISLFNGVKRYQVSLAHHVRDSEEIRVEELPKEVLVGWFAHELGHLVDYTAYSNWGMVRYGLRYLQSEKFRRQAEHHADYLAIAHGFHQEILATKRFILSHDLLDEGYKAKIRKYYLSAEEVELCVAGKTPIPPTVRLPGSHSE